MSEVDGRVGWLMFFIDIHIVHFLLGTIVPPLSPAFHPAISSRCHHNPAKCFAKVFFSLSFIRFFARSFLLATARYHFPCKLRKTTYKYLLVKIAIFYEFLPQLLVLFPLSFFLSLCLHFAVPLHVHRSFSTSHRCHLAIDSGCFFSLRFSFVSFFRHLVSLSLCKTTTTASKRFMYWKSCNGCSFHFCYFSSPFSVSFNEWHSISFFEFFTCFHFVGFLRVCLVSGSREC